MSLLSLPVNPVNKLFSLTVWICCLFDLLLIGVVLRLQNVSKDETKLQGCYHDVFNTVCEIITI